jgi:hypothetical protein
MVPRQTQQQISKRLDGLWTNITDDVPDAKYELILDLAESISQFDSIVARSPKEFRRLMEEILENAHQMMNLFRSLERQFPEIRSVLRTIVIENVAFIRIRDVIEDIKDAVDRLDAIKLPGGSTPPVRLNRARKNMAATCAHLYWVTQHPELPPPTGYDDGPYVRFSNNLFEVATGQKADLTKECRKVLKDHEGERWRRLELRSRRQD